MSTPFDLTLENYLRGLSIGEIVEKGGGSTNVENECIMYSGMNLPLDDLVLLIVKYLLSLNSRYISTQKTINEKSVIFEITYEDQDNKTTITIIQTRSRTIIFQA